MDLCDSVEGRDRTRRLSSLVLRGTGNTSNTALFGAIFSPEFDHTLSSQSSFLGMRALESDCAGQRSSWELCLDGRPFPRLAITRTTAVFSSKTMKARASNSAPSAVPVTAWAAVFCSPRAERQRQHTSRATGRSSDGYLFHPPTSCTRWSRPQHRGLCVWTLRPRLRAFPRRAR